MRTHPRAGAARRRSPASLRLLVQSRLPGAAPDRLEHARRRSWKSSSPTRRCTRSQGWDDLRRRLAPDRRCFAFFHPALPDEPLIFVEVALVAWPRRAGPAAARRRRQAGRARRRRHRDLLFDHQLPGGAARHLLRQFPDQAGRRGAEGGAAEPQAILDPVAGPGLSPLAGTQARGQPRRLDRWRRSTRMTAQALAEMRQGAQVAAGR